MINPEMPNIPNMPGMGAMADTLEYVKKLWGGMGLPGGQSSPGMSIPGMPGVNIPGMVMPTLSVEEINKRITDLKAVESWLNLNMNMLRGSIQALEVQAATLSALNAMGQSVSATMQAAGMPDPMAAARGGNGSARADGNGAAEPEHKTHPGTQPSEQDEQDAAALTAPLVNAAAWWNALQDQFQQAVSSAMTAEPAPAAKKTAAKKTAKPKTASTAARKTTRSRKS